jgi:hypothetical protein
MQQIDDYDRLFESVILQAAAGLPMSRNAHPS